MRWQARLAAALGLAPSTSVTPVGVGRPGDGVARALLAPAAPLDPAWESVAATQADALEAWRKNPLARRLVSLTAGFVVGDGIRLSSPDPELAAFISAFWSHPANRILGRQSAWCEELSRSGELFLALFTNPADGMSYVRAVPAARIDRIETAAGDYEAELRYHEMGDVETPDGAWWPAAAEALDPAPADHGAPAPAHHGAPVPAHHGVPAPAMLHYAVNRPVGALRGEGDLAPVLPWLRRYSRWLEDRIRLNAGLRSFLWVVYAPARSLERLRGSYPRPPEPGSVLIAEEGGERWEAVTPDLHAADAAADGRALRWMIAAGGPGTGLVDLGEGEDANLATATAMQELRRRFLRQRQAYFGWLLADLTLHAFRRRQAALGEPPAAGDAGADAIVVDAPDISAEDNRELAQAAQSITAALHGLRELVGDSEALHAAGLRLFAKFAGQDFTAREVEEMLRGKTQ